MSESLYDILGVAKTAADSDIRGAYRKLARKYHPDVNPGDTAAEDRFKKVAAAYEVLSDDARRKAYDEFGEESLKGGFDPDKARAYQKWQQQRSRGAEPFAGGMGGGGWRRAGGAGGGFDFDLDELFGGRRARPRAARGPDVHAMVDMDLEQAIKGGEVSLEVPGRKPISVRIPPGADDGSIIRLRGKGGAGASGAPAGDLVIETRVRSHPFVRREGQDLFMRLPVTLAEAYSGATIEVPTFDGPVKLRVPPLSQPGQKLRLRGKGVSRKGTSGDLYVELDVRLPDRADPTLAEALRASQDAYSTPVRKELEL
ncbi:MAG TPA: DnaJ C-terminal domain-containing protein [Kofleriaceae bacterium]|nr:DnaJ C-terminal domain-containing protein [Kofleriaceae bacterium]